MINLDKISNENLAKARRLLAEMPEVNPASLNTLANNLNLFGQFISWEEHKEIVKYIANNLEIVACNHMGELRYDQMGTEYIKETVRFHLHMPDLMKEILELYPVHPLYNMIEYQMWIYYKSREISISLSKVWEFAENQLYLDEKSFNSFLLGEF